MQVKFENLKTEGQFLHCSTKLFKSVGFSVHETGKERFRCVLYACECIVLCSTFDPQTIQTDLLTFACPDCIHVAQLQIKKSKKFTVGIHLTHDGPFFMILASSKPHCVCMSRVHYSTGCTNSFVQYRLWQRALVQRLRSSNITSLVPLHPEHLISTTHIIICDTCTCQCWYSDGVQVL